jgi:alkylated DNA repair dioxygenase AlkB
MSSFESLGYTVRRGFINKQLINTVSKYLEFALRRYEWERSKDPVATSYAQYADPLIELILQDYQKDIEKIVNKEVYPTYSYARVYEKGDVLTPHLDRFECEFSVTVNVASVGAPWNIYLKGYDKKTESFILEPGDAIIYKGCEVMHWREESEDTQLCVQFMLHYVDKNGPSSYLKYDGRQALGMPRN